MITFIIIILVMFFLNFLASLVPCEYDGTGIRIGGCKCCDCLGCYRGQVYCMGSDKFHKMEPEK